MRIDLLPQEGQFYKANLHCHTTVSDGYLSPEEMKAAYMKRGYSIIAFSDHNDFVCHNDLTSSDFLALNAYEISIRNPADTAPPVYRKNVDLGLIAKRADMTAGISTAMTVDPTLPYHTQKVNELSCRAEEAGFLVTLNHPAWSLLHYEDYTAYEHLWAVEIYNNETYVDCAVQDMEWVYNDILQSGRNIFCVANDDNHNHRPVGSPTCDSFGGFTVIKAVELSYPAVVAALEQGHFYASQGPAITSLYYEDGKVYIACSEAADICMCTLGRRGRRVVPRDDKPLTSASFVIDPEIHGLIRFRVTDTHGKKAFTNAFYVDDLMPDAAVYHAL